MTAIDRVPTCVSSPVSLKDGSTVTVRPMHADDGPALVRFHGGLSPDTAYLRFLSVHPELSSHEVDRFTHVDHHMRDAFVATVGEEIIGVGRLDRFDEGDDAEIAFVVTDSWQGRGLGSALYERVAQRARALGVRRLIAHTLPHNRRMLDVFAHAEHETTAFDDGVVRVVIDLDAVG